MKNFNLSDWALEHRSFVWYFMIAFAVAGIYAYVSLGRAEAPSFTIKTMVIQAQWPGASAEEVTQQVTDRIEKKLQELDSLDRTRSLTTAGKTTIFVDLLPTAKARHAQPTWPPVRHTTAARRHGRWAAMWSGVFGSNFHAAVSGRSSTTSLVTSTETSSPSAPRVSTKGNYATSSRTLAPRSCRCQMSVRSTSSARGTR